MSNKKNTGTINPSLGQLERFLLHETMHQMGIIPLEKADIDVARILKTLPDDQARILRRKFRKVWRQRWKQERAEAERKFANNKNSLRSVLETIDRRYGVGSKNPSRAARKQRKATVTGVVTTEVARRVEELKRTGK